jgi:hypothetical protein
MSKYHVLTVANPKTQKGTKLGYATAILHLAPASLSGFNVCPMATQGCIAACLNTAGRGGIAKGGLLTHETVANGTRTNAIQQARITKTRAYFEDRTAFMMALAREIAKFVRECEAVGMKPAVRLNGTSDIRWERVPVGTHDNLMAMFPEVQFYDYTKVANRRDLPANYRLTFSLADGNDAQAATALENGMNVAAVFRNEAVRHQYMITGFVLAHAGRCDVIDGDETDLRFLDPQGVIVGLYAKGNAKRDRSGFVRD